MQPKPEGQEHPGRHLRAVTDPNDTEVQSRESLLEHRRELLEKKAAMEREFARQAAALDDELGAVNAAILGVSDTHDSGVRKRQSESKMNGYIGSPESLIETRIITIQTHQTDIERYKKMLAGELKRQISSETGQPLTDEKIHANIKLLQETVDRAWEEIIEISSKVNESEREQKAA